jgi:hypothetical protein
MQALQWTQEVEDPFQTLKGDLCAAPILAYPQPGEGFIVDTDAGNFVIGGVFSEVQDGQERVIAYYNRTLDKAEWNYCVTRRGYLTILRTLEYFHKYPAHGPLIANLVHEFQVPRRTNCTLGLAPSRIQIYFRTS